MTTENTRVRTLRLAGGAGKTHAVPLDVARQYSGKTIHGALGHLIANHIRDPGLRSLLEGPHLAIELSRSGGHESPLSPSGNWDDVLREAEQADTEVGLAQRHDGGTR